MQKVHLLQYREFFHFLFLERLMKFSDPKLYVLKGGVNLRFFFHSPRYSEDMDLDVLAGNVITLKKNGYKILNDISFQRVLKSYGIEGLEINTPSDSKHTQTTQRFKVHLKLASGEVLPTKVEFSRRLRKEKDSFKLGTISSDIVNQYHRSAFFCQHYEASAAIAQKIRAFALRQQTQARDVFDLYLLITMKHSLENIHIDKDIILTGLKNISLLSYEEYLGHVINFLDPIEACHYESKEIWKMIVQTVIKVLKNL